MDKIIRKHIKKIFKKEERKKKREKNLHNYWETSKKIKAKWT